MANAIRRLWDGDHAEVRRCQACGFGFGSPFVGGDEEFYELMHEQHSYPSWRWDYDVALSQAPSGGAALDIGAGRGLFLKGLPEGWSRNAVESTATMKDLLRGDGIEVYEDLRSAPSAAFDLVTMFQVLEHISDFRGTLAECFRVMRPGATITITVPDADAMFDQERLTGCPDSPPNHIGKWTPATLARVLDEQGLTARSVTREPASWGRVAGMLHLKVMADALRRNSLAGRAFAIQDRRVRAPALAAVALATSLPMLVELQKLRAGGAFGITAQKAA